MLYNPQLAMAAISALGVVCGSAAPLLAQGRYATSDNMSGYVHWIELYDANNNRIDPNAEFPQPYSPERTCGRCHEFDTIAHGWHFNATDPAALHGRPGQPWIWSDHRSGTHLPLSYRGWAGTFHPDVLGLSRWEVAAKLGGFLPGGGPGSSTALAAVSPQTQPVATTDAGQPPTADAPIADAPTADADRDRSQITGPLPVDCLMCHRNRGSGYSPFVWTEQIEDQNFAYAPTVALGLGEVSGTLARLKTFDASAPDAASKLPKLTYDQERFRSDGKVFIDLVREPLNDSCYYCHTNVTPDALTGRRWLHDEDVHLRAGLDCVDCHRNGLDHHTVRGFEGEQHPAGALVAAFSCQGCHLGSDGPGTEPLARAGRLGAPRPLHVGLPPLHFDKMSCTACHSGPLPGQEVQRQINSIAHRLGEHVQRTGDEHPVIVGPVNLPVESFQPNPNADGAAAPAHTDTKYSPQRLLWPSYWGLLEDGKVAPLNPETAYELVRKPLKVRRDFTEELGSVSLSLTQRRELLGEERARVKEEERTNEEQAKVREAEKVARQAQINQRLFDALTAVEEQYPGKQAVYVTGGRGWVRSAEDKIKALSAEELGPAAEPYAWPMAHNVRPARQSLGATGCSECHTNDATFFFADVQPQGLVPDQDVAPLKLHQLQHADPQQLQRWNRLFIGRSGFKIASLIALSVTCLITLSVLVWNVGTYWQRRG